MQLCRSRASERYRYDIISAQHAPSWNQVDAKRFRRPGPGAKPQAEGGYELGGLPSSHLRQSGLPESSPRPAASCCCCCCCCEGGWPAPGGGTVTWRPVWLTRRAGSGEGSPLREAEAGWRTHQEGGMEKEAQGRGQRRARGPRRPREGPRDTRAGRRIFPRTSGRKPHPQTDGSPCPSPPARRLKFPTLPRPPQRLPRSRRRWRSCAPSGEPRPAPPSTSPGRAAWPAAKRANRRKRQER